MPQAALADQATVTITPNAPLRFGTLLVPTTGTRTVNAFGVVSDSGLFTVGGPATGPAQFSLVYDRGNESRRVINIQIQVTFSGLQQVTAGGVVGRLSQLDTDLPVSIGTMTGTTMTLTLRGCAQRRCGTSFRVGGRLQVTRNYGGGELVFPLPAVATVLAVF
ncbi:MAG: DUF4402 domain-containing protein [Novosphingobium sp.]